MLRSILLILTWIGNGDGILFSPKLYRNLATSVVAILPMLPLETLQARTGEDALAEIIVIQKQQGLMLTKQGEMLAKQGEVLGTLSSDNKNAKAFIGGVITLSGVSAAIATVVMTYDARAAKLKEAEEKKKNRFW